MPNENNKTMKSDELIEVDANVLKALQLTRAAFAPLAEIDNADFDAQADAVARRAYEIAKLRGLHRKPFFAGQSLSKYFEDLTSLAQVSFSQLLEWLRLRPAHGNVPVSSLEMLSRLLISAAARSTSSCITFTALTRSPSLKVP